MGLQGVIGSSRFISSSLVSKVILDLDQPLLEQLGFGVAGEGLTRFALGSGYRSLLSLHSLNGGSQAVIRSWGKNVLFGRCRG